MRRKKVALSMGQGPPSKRSSNHAAGGTGIIAHVHPRGNSKPQDLAPRIGTTAAGVAFGFGPPKATARRASI